MKTQTAHCSQSIFGARAGWMLFSVCLAQLLPAAAHAACSQWDISGGWSAVQSNDTKPTFVLQQTGAQIHGNANYSYIHKSRCVLAYCGDDTYSVEGSVDGTIEGDSIDITTYWNNDTVGVYTGKINPQGRIEGSTYDRQHPQTMARWYSDRTIKCLADENGAVQADNSPSSNTPPVDSKPPPVALGRTQTGAPAPPLNRVGDEPLICTRARDARTRNSPVAPALEAQCEAARRAAPPPNPLSRLRASPSRAGFRAPAFAVVATPAAVAQPSAQAPLAPPTAAQPPQAPPAAPPPAPAQAAAPVSAPNDLVIGSMRFSQNNKPGPDVVLGTPVAIDCGYYVNASRNAFAGPIRPWQGRVQISGGAPQSLVFQGSVEAGQHVARVTWMPTAAGQVPISCSVNSEFADAEANPGNNRRDRIVLVVDVAAGGGR